MDNPEKSTPDNQSEYVPAPSIERAIDNLNCMNRRMMTVLGHSTIKKRLSFRFSSGS